MLCVHSSTDIATHFDNALTNAPNNQIQTPQDQKRLFRSTLRKMGGTSEDGLAKEFKKLLEKLNLTGIRFYDLRGSINTEMNNAGVSHLVQRYVTGHTLNDILNEYVTLDPSTEMKKYFDYIQPLLSALSERAVGLGLVVE